MAHTHARKSIAIVVTAVLCRLAIAVRLECLGKRDEAVCQACFKSEVVPPQLKSTQCQNCGDTNAPAICVDCLAWPIIDRVKRKNCKRCADGPNPQKCVECLASSISDEVKENVCTQCAASRHPENCLKPFDSKVKAVTFSGDSYLCSECMRYTLRSDMEDTQNAAQRRSEVEVHRLRQFTQASQPVLDQFSDERTGEERQVRRLRS
ncbi:hypothetical protein BSKO_13252 [Bryopsis sp. KO-2023]|nr:hypothetical protein BSKO_13252 [Bryopsis sp. KO-2023]